MDIPITSSNVAIVTGNNEATEILKELVELKRWKNKWESLTDKQISAMTKDEAVKWNNELIAYETRKEIAWKKAFKLFKL
jgi:hypothetical protein